ncbi:hypothetical protein T07_10301 [Trichinella nelsoni]|uniref:Uncharacterized protein n=1 Tax=Trichinella nelsoni TaxID=6336 RepID=A0A0V0SCS5_9BILA|nr:hypothetical protein T07_10301 [Trichinella nelsoni]
MKSNHVRRERKETIEHLKILYLPITFGVSEKRLCGQMLDECLDSMFVFSEFSNVNAEPPSTDGLKLK